MGNPENFNDFYWGLLMGVFVLSRSYKNSVGEKLSPVWKKFRSFGRLPLYWGVTLGWGETKVNCYLVDSQALRHLVGEVGEN